MSREVQEATELPGEAEDATELPALTARWERLGRPPNFFPGCWSVLGFEKSLNCPRGTDGQTWFWHGTRPPEFLGSTSEMSVLFNRGLYLVCLIDLHKFQ